jgi:hypothetical protein
MTLNEPVRFHCGDCQIIFDLCVRGVRETEYAEGAPPITAFSEPSFACPFCGANELTRCLTERSESRLSPEVDCQAGVGSGA